MASFLDQFKSAYESAYWMQKFKNVSIYPKTLEKKSRFSEEEKAVLIKKRWYVYFDYLNPDTQKFERQTPITNNVNREFKDFDSRLKAIKILKQALIDFLAAGNVPDKYNKQKTGGKYTIVSALEFALKEKKNSNLSNRTKEGYEKTVNAFNEWLKKTGRGNRPITDLSDGIIAQFLASLKVSNTTINNYRGDLSAVIKILVKQHYLRENPVIHVEKEDAKPQIDFDYSQEEIKTVIDYLEKNDPLMLMFIRLVSYQFWRPKENCRIRIKDIDLENRTIKAFVKQGKVKTKLIPSILYDDLKTYVKDGNPEDLLFTPEGVGKWERDLDGRRSYFTLRFKRIRKKQGWNPNITIYVFRHYYVTLAFKNILSEVGSEEKAIQVLSKITGHTSKAITKYIHYRDLSLPEDYSDYLK